MGSFDISRINFDTKKHYSSARMQQGRVLTDDDWNENERIEDEVLRQTGVDIIGPFGSPDDGFRISNLRLDSGLINFDILEGILYLGGLRLEMDALETYRLQKDWLQQPASLDALPSLNENERYDLVYIEAWQQAVSAVEDSSLFEVALGGPDTTTRIRNMRRVKLANGIGFCSCTDAWNELIRKWQTSNLGKINNEHERLTDTKLKVSFSDTGLPDDLCTPSAAGGYLGAENQAIRVQIVDRDNFTWGFDNASPLYRVAVSEDGKIVQMLTEPKDQYHWPLSNQVVEILPWSAVLSNGEKVAEQMGHLTKVESSYNPDDGTFTLKDALALAPPFGEDWKSRTDKNELAPPEYFYMRVWNRGDDLSSDPRIPITLGQPIKLGHTGLEITITGNDRVTNDYWVIAARPETPNRVVPWELEKGIAPHGVRLFFAPLAVIRWRRDVNEPSHFSGVIVHDCRKKFHPLTEQECCCTFTVGDGIRSKGDFNSIQEAVDNLPGAGGKICVLPGEHIANVSIFERRQIRITGCGDQSIVRPRPDHNTISKPIFSIHNSQKIQIDQLTIVALNGIGIEVIDKQESKMFSEQITINENRILAAIHAINIHLLEDQGGDNHINISYNKIGMIDKKGGKVAIFCVADAVLIERNRIVVIAAPDGEDPDDPRDPNDPNDGDPFDPCPDLTLTYRPGFSIFFQIFLLLRYVNLYFPSGRSQKKYLAMGGIQIGGTSERVCIKQNEIIGGRGNGITLGHLNLNNPKYSFKISEVKFIYSSLYDISIEENNIMQMGLSGISTLLYFEKAQSYVTVKDITVYRNIIRLCARQIPLVEIPTDFNKYLAYGGVVLNDCEVGRIQENRIEKNGLFLGMPICGVFLYYGEKIDLSNNSILNNGLPVTFEHADVRTGNRGGIVIKMSFKPSDIKEWLESKMPSFDGVPAVKIHDNVVVQPHGFALFLFVFGPVSIVSNQFTSMGTDTKNQLSLLASTVFILNLGISKDLFTFTFQNMAKTNTQKLSSKQISSGILYLPNGKVIFTGNQTTLDMTSPLINLCLSSQFIASLDDVAFNNNQSECSGFISFIEERIVFDFVFFNTVLFGITVRSNDNRFSDGVTFTFYSLLSFGLMATAIGNQSTHCLLVKGFKEAINSNLVFDDERCSEK